MAFLHGISILLGFQFLGELLVRLLAWPLPGPVLGMGLLLLGLAFSKTLIDHIESAAQGLLGHLALLFVPAGVGVLPHLDAISKHWLALGLSLLLGTLITLGVTALVMALLMRLMKKKPA
jgi:putative effector of murein hydrolase LrgA (UPF0299 family)